MYCDGGPYKYHDDLFRFTFYQEDGGYFTFEKLEINGDLKPCPRSQSYIWFGMKTGSRHITNNIYGYMVDIVQLRR